MYSATTTQMSVIILIKPLFIWKQPSPPIPVFVILRVEYSQFCEVQNRKKNYKIQDDLGGRGKKLFFLRFHLCSVYLNSN